MTSKSHHELPILLGQGGLISVNLTFSISGTEKRKPQELLNQQLWGEAQQDRFSWSPQGHSGCFSSAGTTGTW